MPNYAITSNFRFPPFQRFLVHPINDYVQIISMVYCIDICSNGNIVSSFQGFLYPYHHYLRTYLHTHTYTVYVACLANIKLSKLECIANWQTFSLADRK